MHLVVLAMWGIMSLFAGAQQPPAGMTVIEPRLAKSVDTLAGSGQITYGRWNLDGYVDVWTCDSDGDNRTCVTRGVEGLPQLHNGNPAWHPNGEWIVFTAQNPDATEKRLSDLAVPGNGLNCNIWCIRPDGFDPVQLTHIPTSHTRPAGVLHPQFSHDGSTLFWAGPEGVYEPGVTWGQWAMRLADVTMGAEGPELSNIRTLQPGGARCFYESHGFSPSDDRIIFCGNLQPNQPVEGMDIYTLNLDTGDLLRLTESFHDWDEHAHFSPDGSRIAWMSGRGLDVQISSMKTGRWQQDLKTELWVMDADGSNRRRLTFFNEPAHPHSEWIGGGRAVISDSAWMPDGERIIFCLVTDEPSIGKMRSRLVILDLADIEPNDQRA